MKRPKLPYIELWQSSGNDKWYFHKRNRNNTVTEPSQGYTTRSSARRAAKRDIPGLPIVVLV